MNTNSALETTPLRHFLRVLDFSRDELLELLSLASELKEKQRKAIEHKMLAGKTVALILEKPSARTRISFEVGIFQLGAHPIFINPNEIKMGEREPIADVARTISRYVDGVMIRSFYHWTIEEFSAAATVPVINGLSDHHHPCQALADILTVQERKKELERVKICYIGDGNNVCNSLIEICTTLGIELVVACPPGYEPLFNQKNSRVTITHDAAEGVSNADVIYTDVWISMGQESLTGRKLNEFLKFAITPELMKRAAPDALFMHCLPAHRGLEVDARVIDGPQSVVFDQAENRLHAQKAVLAKLMA